MNRLLIIGCGDVMRRALPKLTRRYRVYALVRKHDAELTTMGITQIVGDLDQPATLKRLAGLADLVLHSAPPPSNGNADPRTRNLLAALRQGHRPPRRIVYISTSGIYGDCAGALVAESYPGKASTPRAKRRLSAEAQLRHFGKKAGRVSLLRAPGIYAGDRLPLERLHRGDPVLMANEDVYTNHIHADDLARACLKALHRGGANRSYNVSDDSALLMGDWYDLLADRHDLPRPPRVSRPNLAEQLSPLTLSFMSESRRLDNTRIKTEWGFKFNFPQVHDALPPTKKSAPESAAESPPKAAKEAKKLKPRLRVTAIASPAEEQLDLFRAPD